MLEFAGHKTATSLETAATWFEYEPCGTLVHAADPVVSLYVPAMQALQKLPDIVYPLLHRQSLIEVLSAAEFEFAGQAVHADVEPVPLTNLPASQLVQDASPGTVLNLPATHSVHTPPSAPVYPALHLHAVGTELPLGDAALASHEVHKLDAVAAAVVEYVFAEQAMQSVDPTELLYLPAVHAVHAPPEPV